MYYSLSLKSREGSFANSLQYIVSTKTFNSVLLQKTGGTCGKVNAKNIYVGQRSSFRLIVEMLGYALHPNRVLLAKSSFVLRMP